MEHTNASWPTWIDAGTTGLAFLTDTKCKEAEISLEDAPRRHIIERFSGINLGSDDRPKPFRNGFPVPRLMVKAIQAGECREIMLADGQYELVAVDDQGHLHCDDGPAVIYTETATKRFYPHQYRKGGKMHLWYEHGTCTKLELVQGKARN